MKVVSLWIQVVLRLKIITVEKKSDFKMKCYWICGLNCN